MNRISVRKLEVRNLSEQSVKGAADPVLVSEARESDCNELACVGNDIVSVWGSGDVVRHTLGGAAGEYSLQEQRWCGSKLHKGAATSVDLRPSGFGAGFGAGPALTGELATTGEDGALHLLSLEQPRPLRSLNKASTSACMKVRWSSPDCLLTCGMGARLLVWDVRSDMAKPQHVAYEPHCTNLTALCVHPARPHIMATGSACGVLSIWDHRKGSAPLSSIQALPSAVWSAAFLPNQQTSMVVCGEDGSVLFWDFNAAKLDPSLVTFEASGEKADIRRTLLYRSALSVNTLVAEDHGTVDTVLCGTDTEELLCFQI